MTALSSDPRAVILATTPSRRHGRWHWASLVLSWFLLLAFSATLVVAVLIPRLAGATPYVIETGSMRPSMPPGSLVIAKPIDPVDVAAGDVITYQLRSGDSTVVTHRVISVGFDGVGDPRWRTQGDANNAADKSWVMPAQLKGEEWYTVPYLGYVASFLQGSARNLVLGVVVIGLIGYALRMFQQSWSERRQGGGAA